MEAGSKSNGNLCFRRHVALDFFHFLMDIFSSLAQRPIPGLAFFAFSLINVRLRRSSPIQFEQIVRSAEEKAVCKTKAQARKTKKKLNEKRKPGRPKGSKNKDKQQVELNPELKRIHSMLQALLKLIFTFLSLKYLVLDGHFGNWPAAWMVRQNQLHLVSKLRHDAGLYLPYVGPKPRRGPTPKWGVKIAYDHLPEAGFTLLNQPFLPPNWRRYCW